MAGESVQDDVLPLARLKLMLGRAEDAVLGCAIALAKDKKDFVLLIDLKLPGRKVRDKLRGELDDRFDKGLMRFGQVTIEAADPGTVQMNLNKAAPGGALPLLIKLIKRAGYQGVALNEDLSLEADAPEAPLVDGGPARAASTQMDTTIPEPPPAPSPLPGDAKVLLAALIKRVGPVAAADPAVKDSLMLLARTAHTKLTEGQPIKAELMALKSALDAAAANALPPLVVGEGAKPKDGPTVALAKSNTLWRATRSQMRGKLDKLKTAILDAYADKADVQAAVRQNFGALDRIFETLDDRLDTALDNAIVAKDANDRLEFIEQAQDIIDEYSQRVASDTLIGQLDANPFGVDMRFKETLDKVLPTLSGLARTLH